MVAKKNNAAIDGRGRPQKPRLEPENLELIKWLIEEKRLKKHTLAWAAAITYRQLAYILSGARGVDDQGRSLVAAALVIQHSSTATSTKGKVKTKPPYKLDLLGEKFIKKHCFDSTTAPTAREPSGAHALIDYLTLDSLLPDPFSEDKVLEIDSQLQQKGLHTKLRLRSFNATQIKGSFWALSAHGPGFALRVGRKLWGRPGFSRDIRLELKGRYARSNEGRKLADLWFWPNALPQELLISRLDVAVDVDLPQCCILPLRAWMPTKPRPLKIPNRRFYYRDNDKVCGSYIGPAASSRRIHLYDKAEQHFVMNPEDEAAGKQLGDAAGLRHTKGWEHCTRIEARLRGFRCYENVDKDENLLQTIANPFKGLHLIDLRQIPDDEPYRMLIYLCKGYDVENVARLYLCKHPEGRRALRRRLLEYANRWPWVAPAEVFERQREALQKQLDIFLPRPSW